MEMEGLCSDVAVVERLVCSAMEALVAKTVILAAKSLACLFFMMGSLPSDIDVLLKEPSAIERVSIPDRNMEKQPDPDIKDASEVEVDDEGDDGEDEQNEDLDGKEDKLSSEEGNNDDGGGDPEDKPEATGEGGSEEEEEEEDDDDDDDDDEDDDDTDDDEDDDDDDEEEEEEEEIPQPPAKKRK